MTTRQRTILTLFLLLAVGAFFRFHDLGVAAFRADTMLLQRLAQKQVPPGELLTDWFEVSGLAGQLPLPAVIAQVFYAAADWPTGAGAIRFPYAVLGLLALPVAYFGGRRFLGERFAVLFSLLLAVNAFHLAFSRQAYFYGSMLLGHFLLFWAIAAILPVLWDRGRLGWREGVLLAAGLFFSAYSQLAGLLLCVTAGLLLGGLLLVRQFRREGFWRNALLLGGIYAVILLPLLIVPWGLAPILKQIAATRESAQSVVALSDETLLGTVSLALCRYSWGTTPWGILMMISAIAAAAAAAVLHKSWKLAAMACFIFMPVLLFALARVLISLMLEPRYLLGVFPFFLAILAYGLASVPDLLTRLKVPEKAARVAGWGVPALFFLPLLYPAWLQTQVSGRPVPYHKIIEATNGLPQGSPVLVDRWLEPWNELQAHPSTNVVFTFTLPSEPIETFRQIKWRDTAQGFFDLNPDGAYLEIWKTYWDQPDVGPWEVPPVFFKRHEQVVNQAGLALRKLGLAARSDFYMPFRNGLVVDLYYNTREDVMERAREKGTTTLGFFGTGWQYIKPFWPQGDYRAFRMMNSRAALDFVNLTDREQPVIVTLSAMSAGGPKAVDCAAQVQHTFASYQMFHWQFGPVTVPPGESRVLLTNLRPESAKVPLLVQQFQVAPASSP